MVTKATEDLIHKAMPSAKIVKSAGKHVVSDSVTPDAGALLRKYGGARGDVIRSRVVADSPATAAAHAHELESCVVEVSTNGSVPERLRRRTLIINNRLGKIVGTSG